MSTVTFLVAVAAIVFAISFMRSATHADRTGDAQVVAQLRKAGSDLSKPHPVEFFLYFPSKAAADRVSDKLNSMGFHVAGQ
ncbi:ribonuclease E inhibitor RraB [Massilia sp. B-10]|nr:ribonuclease E inhibitor RraB [Massilia sp. B-10]